MYRLLILLLLLVPILGSAAFAEDTEDVLPFHLPVPEGWRTETIPFPLSFAPELKYEGLEELRFAPGMFDAEKDDFWSYAFVWWIGSDSKLDAAGLSSDLEAYFRGLALAVAKQGGFEPVAPIFSAKINETAAKAGENRLFRGEVETLDAFVTRESVHLQVRIEIVPCDKQKRLAVHFSLSPQPASHGVWETLTAIRQGFQCRPELS